MSNPKASPWGQGPHGEDGGGHVVCTGTPEEVARCDASYTGRYLKRVL